MFALLALVFSNVDAHAVRAGVFDCNPIGGQYVGAQNGEVCGEPVWSCPSDVSCTEVMPAPKTYPNCAALNKDGATFQGFGACPGGSAEVPLQMTVSLHGYRDCVRKVKGMNGIPPYVAPWKGGNGGDLTPEAYCRKLFPHSGGFGRCDMQPHKNVLSADIIPIQTWSAVPNVHVCAELCGALAKPGDVCRFANPGNGCYLWRFPSWYKIMPDNEEESWVGVCK